MGRPTKFGTLKELQDKIDAYFEYADTSKKPYTIAGLAYYIGCNRDTLYSYGREENIDKEYSVAIKNARDRILFKLEESTLEADRKNVTGPIFVLKNYGYSDRDPRQDNSPIAITVEFKPQK